MSAKTSKRNTATKANNTLITKKKSATQNRKGRGRAKKLSKSVITETINKTEVELPQLTKIDIVNDQDTPLKNKVKALIQLVEQAEYYPDKLKRDISSKKIVLKPKHNFKIIATANKRKLATPQKGGLPSISPNFIKLPDSNNYCSKVSMVDMVKLIEENHNLSDEDFMEILTCPSPVWWEDPPDESYVEDPICTRFPESPVSEVIANKIQSVKQTKADNRIRSQLNRTRTKTNNDSLKNEIKEIKITTLIEKNIEKFNEKKQKLENILGNIKNVKQCDEDNIHMKYELQNDGVNSNNSTPVKNRRHSNSTDENMSDISFNEEEILKNLENFDIPVQQSTDQNMNENDKVKIHLEGSETTITTVKNAVKPTKPINVLSNKRITIPDRLPPLKRKPDIKQNEIINDNSDSYSGYNLDYVSHSNFRFISDDDVSIIETNNLDTSTDGNIKNVINVSHFERKSLSKNVNSFKNKCYESKKECINTKNDRDTGKANESSLQSLKSSADDVSEYITVYKIASNNTANKDKGMVTKFFENPNNSEAGKGKGKLNTFYKKCKSNKRLKTSDGTSPALPTSVKDFKIIKRNNDKREKGINLKQLKSSGIISVMRTGNGVKNFPHRHYGKANFTCNKCNFQTDTNESYKKHLTCCKDVDRISWKHNFLTK